MKANPDKCHLLFNRNGQKEIKVAGLVTKSGLNKKPMLLPLQLSVICIVKTS